MDQSNEQLKKAKELATFIEKVLDDKKGVDITVLPVTARTVLADYFVICTGNSTTHVKALADEAEFKAEEVLGIKPGHIEGFSDNMWTLLDYGTVIVHIFTKEGREFYKLDKLWKEAGV